MDGRRGAVGRTGLALTRGRPCRSVAVAAGRTRSGERGQAVVETVALLPIFLILALALAQGGVAGWAAWSAAGAARLAAREQALGGDPERALRALPAHLGRGGHVDVVDRGQRVRVRLRVPAVLPGVRFGRVSGEAGLPPQGPA